MISWIFAQFMRIAAVQANKRCRLGALPYDRVTYYPGGGCTCPSCALAMGADALEA
jgi:hypothetical protein